MLVLFEKGGTRKLSACQLRSSPFLIDRTERLVASQETEFEYPTGRYFFTDCNGAADEQAGEKHRPSELCLGILIKRDLVFTELLRYIKDYHDG